MKQLSIINIRHILQSLTLQTYLQHVPEEKITYNSPPDSRNNMNSSIIHANTVVFRSRVLMCKKANTARRHLHIFISMKAKPLKPCRYAHT